MGFFPACAIAEAAERRAAMAELAQASPGLYFDILRFVIGDDAVDEIGDYGQCSVENAYVYGDLLTCGFVDPARPLSDGDPAMQEAFLQRLDEVADERRAIALYLSVGAPSSGFPLTVDEIAVDGEPVSVRDLLERA